MEIINHLLNTSNSPLLELQISHKKVVARNVKLEEDLPQEAGVRYGKQPSDRAWQNQLFLQLWHHPGKFAGVLLLC